MSFPAVRPGQDNRRLTGAIFVVTCGGGSATTGTATLAWTPPTGLVAGYRVYYGTPSRSYSQALGNGTFATGTTFTVSSLPAGYSYYFAVTAPNAAGAERPYSNEASKPIP